MDFTITGLNKLEVLRELTEDVCRFANLSKVSELATTQGVEVICVNPEGIEFRFLLGQKHKTLVVYRAGCFIFYGPADDVLTWESARNKVANLEG